MRKQLHELINIRRLLDLLLRTGCLFYRSTSGIKALQANKPRHTLVCDCFNFVNIHKNCSFMCPAYMCLYLHIPLVSQSARKYVPDFVFKFLIGF